MPDQSNASMETTSPPPGAASRLHQIAKQILEVVNKIQEFAIRFERNQTTANVVTVEQECMIPFATLLGEFEKIGDVETSLAPFVRAALSLKLDIARRKFRNIEASSVHGLTLWIDHFFLRLWCRSFALQKGDPIPETVLSPDLAEHSMTLNSLIRTLPDSDKLPDVRECLKVDDPTIVGFRWFMRDCYTCLNEWNPSPLLADLEREFHMADQDDRSSALVTPESVHSPNVGDGEPLTEAEPIKATNLSSSMDNSQHLIEALRRYHDAASSCLFNLLRFQEFLANCPRTPQ